VIHSLLLLLLLGVAGVLAGIAAAKATTSRRLSYWQGLVAALLLAYVFVFLVGMSKGMPTTFNGFVGEIVLALFTSPAAILIAVIVFILMTRRRRGQPR
jgi:hypothetical protein